MASGFFEELDQHLAPSNTQSADAVLCAIVEFRMSGSLQNPSNGDGDNGP
jgi:hypothetical protein